MMAPCYSCRFDVPVNARVCGHCRAPLSWKSILHTWGQGSKGGQYYVHVSSPRQEPKIVYDYDDDDDYDEDDYDYDYDDDEDEDNTTADDYPYADGSWAQPIKETVSKPKSQVTYLQVAGVKQKDSTKNIVKDSTKDSTKDWPVNLHIGISSIIFCSLLFVEMSLTDFFNMNSILWWASMGSITIASLTIVGIPIHYYRKEKYK